MRSLIVTGVVIRRHNYQETDRIITLFTRGEGKLSVIAKGLRRPTSKRLSSLQLFNLVKAQVIATRELGVITEVSLLDSFPAWRGQLGRVTLAYQLCETVDKLTAASSPHPEVYDLLVHYLTSLSRLGSDWQAEFDSWLTTIVYHLGFLPAPVYSGNIKEFIESLAQSPLNSHRLLTGLKRKEPKLL